MYAKNKTIAIVFLLIKQAILSNTPEEIQYFQGLFTTQFDVNTQMFLPEPNIVHNNSSFNSQLLFIPNFQPLLVSSHPMPIENKQLNRTQHERRHHPYQRPINSSLQNNPLNILTFTNPNLHNYPLAQPSFEIQPNDPSSYFVTYQSILRAIKTPKLDAFDNKTEFDIKSNIDFYKLKIEIIDNIQLLKINLHSLIQRTMKYNKTPETSVDIFHIVELITKEFECDHKQTALFTIFILFFTKGFRRYLVVDGLKICDNLFNRYKRNNLFNDKSIVNSIKTWKNFNLKFDTIKEGYDILVNLGKYYIFDPRYVNTIFIAHSYKGYILYYLENLFKRHLIGNN
ncbi:hypothetical protein TUBRATIS_24040 [Tubulinosema ratisbonensis]|uniref:Cyclin N-terminal domain-containing protein n=1 Tax=Tubulinosema ratisbonensis TaxID=291195 RepID=A0A437AIZ7_9MICR|nr:hypothetical protein TUBRATIS_24040 [Tubulinosema ratisbonensis]